jgi:hypothetical protein
MADACPRFVATVICLQYQEISIELSGYKTANTVARSAETPQIQTLNSQTFGLILCRLQFPFRTICEGMINDARAAGAGVPPKDGRRSR